MNYLSYIGVWWDGHLATTHRGSHLLADPNRPNATEPRSAARRTLIQQARFPRLDEVAWALLSPSGLPRGGDARVELFD
jgi:hypothetical protein